MWCQWWSESVRAHKMNERIVSRMHSIEHEIQYKIHFTMKWVNDYTMNTIYARTHLYTHTPKREARELLYSCWKSTTISNGNDGSFDARNGKYTYTYTHTIVSQQLNIYLKTQCLNGITANKFEIIVLLLVLWILFFLTLSLKVAHSQLSSV